MSAQQHPDFAKLSALLERIRAFNKARDWNQFHNPKDLAVSLSLEAAEVLEHFQWKNTDEMQRHLEDNCEKVADELADVLYWLLLMGDNFNIDLTEALDRKLTKTEAKYPADKYAGRHNNKYDAGGKYSEPN
jgi:dCTP diphosphatase